MASRENTAKHRAATNVPTRESAMVLISDGAGELLLLSDGPLLPLLLALSLKRNKIKDEIDDDGEVGMAVGIVGGRLEGR